MTIEHGKRLSPTLRKELWRRWCEGESVAEVSRAIGVWPPSVYHQIRQAGGVAPHFCRRPDALTEAEREEISRYVAMAWSVRRIARQLKRAPSTISRELRRSGGRADYRA